MSDNSFAGINFDDPESKKIFETSSKMMCPRYKNSNENSFIKNLNYVKENDGSLVITGTVNINSYNNQYYIKYTAANSPTFSANYSGSGLPFPTEEIAFENTENRGVTNILNGKFSFNLRFPNSYYVNMGTVYVNPHVKIQLFNKDNKPIGTPKIVHLDEGIPFRTLTWPVQRNWNKGPLFYKNDNLPVRTQYQILLDSAYPSTNKIPNNFWGLMPPH